MRKHLAALGCGLLFGLGLAISQMALPVKVLGFLDVTGDWDPSLLFVLGGAVAVTIVGFRFIPRMAKPVFDTSFEAPPQGRINARLLSGAALFGIGWGLAGYCPGPGIVSLGRLAPDAFVFAATFVLGSWLFRLSQARVRGNSRARNSDGSSEIRNQFATESGS